MLRSTSSLKIDILKLQVFEGCHDANVQRGEYIGVIKGKKKAKEDAKAKKVAYCSNQDNQLGNLTSKTATISALRACGALVIIEEIIMNAHAMTVTVMAAAMTGT